MALTLPRILFARTCSSMKRVKSGHFSWWQLILLARTSLQHCFNQISVLGKCYSLNLDRRIDCPGLWWWDLWNRMVKLSMLWRQLSHNHSSEKIKAKTWNLLLEPQASLVASCVSGAYHSHTLISCHVSMVVQRLDTQDVSSSKGYLFGLSGLIRCCV